MKKSHSTSALTDKSKTLMQKMGDNILVAIKKRKLQRKEVEDMALVSAPTLRAIIKGDPKVGFGCYMSVLAVLGLEDDIAKVASPENDEVGLALSEKDLNKRIRKKASKYEF